MDLSFFVDSLNEFAVHSYLQKAKNQSDNIKQKINFDKSYLWLMEK